jgi:hypothetical protein
MTSRAARTYALYAAAFLGATALSGLWLRATLALPALGGGFTFGNAVHAHSHLAFFGWVTMALCAVIVAAVRDAGAAAALRAGARPAAAMAGGADAGAGPGGERALQLHAHLLGIASALAFAGFLERGYDRFTIGLSTVHVLLWAAFVVAVWPATATLAAVPRRFFRCALLFLLVAGLGAMAPGLVLVRGIQDPWLADAAVKLFLVPFLFGWVLLGAMGAAYQRLGGGGRFATAALVLVAVGTLPSVPLLVGAAPPADWLPLLGRAGTLLVGAGVLAFAGDLLAAAAGRGVGRPVPALLLLAAAGAVVKGGLDLLAATGVSGHLLTSRPLVLAYLHLVLLGIVTPALVGALFPALRARAATALHAAGLALMLAALVALGWPALARLVVGQGVPLVGLHHGALAGGAVSTAALLWLAGAGAAATVRGAAGSLPRPAPRPAERPAGRSRLRPGAGAVAVSGEQQRG